METEHCGSAAKLLRYYRSFAASYGLQAGTQSFGYVLFLMDKESLSYLDKSDGCELGTGPSLVVVDKGVEKNLSTTTLQKGVFAFIFNQKGLMGGDRNAGNKDNQDFPRSIIETPFPMLQILFGGRRC